MDWGLALTIIFGLISLIGIFLGWKAWNRPKISMVAENSTILANLTQSASGISVRYENKDVSNNLILLSVYLINNGNSDIDIRDVEQPVTIVLPEGSKWLSFKVIANKHEMIIKESHNDNELILDVGLWKKREGFKFDSLISLENEGKIYNKNEIFECFTIKSRIKGLDKVDILYLQEEKKYKNKKFKNIKTFVLPCIALILYGALGAFMYFDIPNTNKFNFKIYNDNQEVTLKSNNNIVEIYSEGNLIEKRKDGLYDLQIKAEQVTVSKAQKVMGMFTIFSGFFLFCILIYKDLMTYLLRKKLDFNH